MISYKWISSLMCYNESFVVILLGLCCKGYRESIDNLERKWVRKSNESEKNENKVQLLMKIENFIVYLLMNEKQRIE